MSSSGDQLLSSSRGNFNEVLVKVRDTGIGISSDNKSKLFQLFGYLHDTSFLNK
jgi:signal transduction histidine kinase